MKDYEGFAPGQKVWPFERQMYFVMPVPAFNQPVRIRDVELRTVQGIGQFDHPAAFLLKYEDSLIYSGATLTYRLRPQDLAGAQRKPLSRLRVQKLDNQLYVVIPVNVHERGCHEAQVVFRVSTSDGTLHTFTTRWYVGLDTGNVRVDGLNLCAGGSG